MIDMFERNINYLRLSVTDLCNLRCTYCMPEKGIEKLEHEEILSVEEIEDIVKASAKCGINKVRITGGDPLVRKGIVDICKRVSSIEGIKEVCITTNGILLKKYAVELKEAGVNRLNISLDTLKEEKYQKITRCGKIQDVIDGIEKCKQIGYEKIKINVVLIGGFNDDEISDFVELTRNDDLQVRFIELMPMGECQEWDENVFFETNVVLEKKPELIPVGSEGVARIFKLPDGKGTVGLISPMSRHFCPDCNRIRVTSDGKLKVCLHSESEINLKGLKEAEIVEVIKEGIKLKPQNSTISVDKKSSTKRYMNQIGG